MNVDLVDPLSVGEAAEALGVHYMTAYRYIRTGQLPAEQHGGRWQIRATALEDFRAGSQRHDHPVGRRRDASSATGGTRNTSWRVVSLAERLVLGDQAGAWRIVETALMAGATPSDIYIEMMTPALRRIGDRWERGEITVAEEHRASIIAMRLISMLGARFARRGRTRGTVVLAAAPGDRHALPTAILADLLRGEGINVADLGADTPAKALASAAAAADRLIGVGVCATTSLDRTSLDDLSEAIRLVRNGPGCPVLLGGAAVTPDLASLLGVDAQTVDARQALAWFDQLPATGGRSRGAKSRASSP